MAGSRAFRFLQMGRESTAGTAVAASTIWRGPAEGLSDDRTVEFPAEDIGYAGGGDRAYIPRLAGSYNMPETPMTFEQVLHLFEAGVETETPTQDGSGDGYIYTYNMPTTAANTIKTYTLEAGDDQQGEEMEYCFVPSFSLRGRAGEGWMMGAQWTGRQVANATKTGALSIPAVEELLFGTTTLAIDGEGDTVGDTAVSNTLYEANLTVNTGLRPFFTADQLSFNTHLLARPEVTLALTFLHNGSAVTEKGNWRTETPRQIQLKVESPTDFGMTGTAYDKPTFIINLAGKWQTFDTLGEVEGGDVIQATFLARYNATAALYAQFIDVVALSSIP